MCVNEEENACVRLWAYTQWALVSNGECTHNFCLFVRKLCRVPSNIVFLFTRLSRWGSPEETFDLSSLASCLWITFWRDAREMSNTNCIIHGLWFRMQRGSRCLSPWNNSYLISFECENDFPVPVVSLKSAAKHGDASVRSCHGNSGLQTGKEN